MSVLILFFVLYQMKRIYCLSVILQEESHTIGLGSIQIDKCESTPKVANQKKDKQTSAGKMMFSFLKLFNA